MEYGIKVEMNPGSLARNSQEEVKWTKEGT